MTSGLYWYLLSSLIFIFWKFPISDYKTHDCEVDSRSFICESRILIHSPVFRFPCVSPILSTTVLQVSCTSSFFALYKRSLWHVSQHLEFCLFGLGYLVLITRVVRLQNSCQNCYSYTLWLGYTLQSAKRPIVPLEQPLIPSFEDTFFGCEEDTFGAHPDRNRPDDFWLFSFRRSSSGMRQRESNNSLRYSKCFWGSCLCQGTLWASFYDFPAYRVRL